MWIVIWECGIEYFLIQVVIWLVWKPDDFKAIEHFSMSYVFKSQGFLFLLIKFHEWRNHWRNCPTVFSSHIHTHIILSCTCQQYVSCLLYVSRQSSERHINMANIAVRIRKNGLMFQDTECVQQWSICCTLACMLSHYIHTIRNMYNTSHIYIYIYIYKNTHIYTYIYIYIHIYMLCPTPLCVFYKHSRNLLIHNNITQW